MHAEIHVGDLFVCNCGFCSNEVFIVVELSGYDNITVITGMTFSLTSKVSFLQDYRPESVTVISSIDASHD